MEQINILLQWKILNITSKRGDKGWEKDSGFALIRMWSGGIVDKLWAFDNLYLLVTF